MQRNPPVSASPVILALIAMLCPMGPSASAEETLADIDREIARETDVWITPAGLYVSGSFGFLFPDDVELNNVDGVVPAQNTEFELDGIWSSHAAIGWDAGPVRSEVEGGVRFLDIDQITLDGVGVPSTGGDVDIYTLMFNVYYDLPITDRFGGYIGAGVGGAFVDVEPQSTAFEDSDDFLFGYQFMAGLQYEVFPRFYLMSGYRYFNTESADFDGVNTESFDVHSIDVGIRYVF
jgi:opacity protein-like surface antigen